MISKVEREFHALTLIAIISTILMLSIFPISIKASKSIMVEDLGDRVKVDNGVLEVELMKRGVRACKWIIKSTGLNLANAGDRFAIGKSYPLWDWLTNEEWPGSLCLSTYKFKLLAKNETHAVLLFTLKLNTGVNKGLLIRKIITFTKDNYVVEYSIELENTSNRTLEVKDYFGDGLIGYTIAWCGIIGKSMTNDLQGWKINGKIFWNKKEHFIRTYSTDVKWCCLYDIEEGGIAILIPHNNTIAIWREADPAWGFEVRLEFPAFKLRPNEKIRYLITIYAGPLSAKNLEELGLYEIAMKLKLTSKILIDRIIYPPNSKINGKVIIRNNAETKTSGYLIAKFFKDTQVIHQEKVGYIEVPALSKIEINFSITAPSQEGLYELALYILTKGEETILNTIKFAIADPTKRNKLYIAFVWHNHQAPNFYPNGVYHALWAFIHTYEDEFKPYYNGGAYLVHTYIMLKHPKIKATYHLSPSLLYQWYQAITEGYKTTPYTVIKLPDPRVQRVKEALDNYKKLLKEDRIEVITSFFAHPIAGFLVKRFEKYSDLIEELLTWELSEGFNITQKVMGVKAKGAWCPEMFWDMRLIKIFNKVGIKYVILCEQHFKQSRDDKGDIYEPYIVKDPLTGQSIIIFFRDHQLSDWIGFRNVMPTLDDVENNVREFILALYDRYIKHPGKVVVIALDGENWMIMSKFPPHTAVFLDRLFQELEKHYDYFQTVTLSEALELVKPKRILTHVPWGSWIGLTAVQWTGGVKDKLWEYIEDKLEVINAFRKSLKDGKEILNKIYKALAIAVDSDYFWYGEYEGNQKVIKTWADYSERIVLNELGKIKIVKIEVMKDILSIIIDNNSTYTISFNIAINDKIVTKSEIEPGRNIVTVNLKQIKGILEKENTVKLLIERIEVSQGKFEIKETGYGNIIRMLGVLGICLIAIFTIVYIIVNLFRRLKKGVIRREVLRI